MFWDPPTRHTYSEVSSVALDGSVDFLTCLSLEGRRLVYVQAPICVRVFTILHEMHHSDPYASHVYPHTSLHLHTSHQTEAETHFQVYMQQAARVVGNE